MKYKDTLSKAAKIAGVTCLALGSIAVISSGAALNGAVAGFRYVSQSVKKILSDSKTNTAEAAPVTE